MLGLESFEAQMQIMQEMPLREQLKSLKALATNFKRFRRNLKQTAALYVEGDPQKILKKVKLSSGKMRKILIYDRNLTMTQRILEISQEQSLFAAIGAGHLGGAKGVLRLLKHAGCQLSPVFYK